MWESITAENVMQKYRTFWTVHKLSSTSVSKNATQFWNKILWSDTFCTGSLWWQFPYLDWLRAALWLSAWGPGFEFEGHMHGVCMLFPFWHCCTPVSFPWNTSSYENGTRNRDCEPYWAQGLGMETISVQCWGIWVT